MSNYLSKLNNVLFNIKDELTLEALNFLKLEDIEEFFESIGYTWTRGCTFDDSTNANVEDVNDIYELYDLLNKEIDNDDECIYSDKNCLVFELFEPNERFPEILEFYISPYIFYHRSNAYTISLDGTTTFHDEDYSIKWISFLLNKYGKSYADAISKQLKNGILKTNSKHEKDIEEIKLVLDKIAKFEINDAKIERAIKLNEEAIEFIKNGNPEPAVENWKKSYYELGSLGAAYNLAMCYDDGYGVEKDDKKAFELYLAVAKANPRQVQKTAQFNVGNSYFMGRGVEKDIQQALYWYTKAADNGHEVAQFNLATMYAQGKHVDFDFSKSFHYAKLAVENGFIPACFQLGFCYLSGNGTEFNIEKAKEVFKLGADHGDKNCEMLYNQILLDEQKD